jgi:hypothetical protein
MTFLAEMHERSKNKSYGQQLTTMARNLRKHAWTISYSDTNLTYTQRIRVLNNQSLHELWIYNLQKHWAKNEPERVCAYVYPMLSHMLAKSPQDKLLRNDALTYVDQMLPKLLRDDDACAFSLLNLEALILRTDPQSLGAKYLARRDWPMTRTYTTLVFEVAELNYASGHHAAARELWNNIRDKAPKDAPELSFAKVRLDTSRTEYDGLWR